MVSKQVLLPPYPDYPVYVTTSGNHILQQSGAVRTNNCGPACIAMLSLDYNSKHIDIDSVIADVTREMEVDKLALYLPKGLSLNITECLTDGSEDILVMLKSIISEQGSTIVGLSNPAHYVILDQVSEAHISIRDPWHGWSVNIHPTTLLEMIGNSEPVHFISINN